jgi:tRNA (guanine37-N1)-methyltransferase
MDFTVLTLFPDLVSSFFEHSLIGRAIENKLILGRSINIRDFSNDHHNSVDGKPYGGGSGMVMKPGPLDRAIRYAKEISPDSRVILMTPQGEKFDQKKAGLFASRKEGLIFVCGRYEGIDERIYNTLVDDEISIGDYVMTGGELASMVIIDSVARLLPEVLGNEASSQSDSFTDDRLEYAQYTRPSEFKEITVPDVLLSGNHEKIRQWRKVSSLHRTFLKRPDLFEKNAPSAEEKKILKQWCLKLEAVVNG